MINLLKQKYSNFVTDIQFSEILTGSVWALSARVLATVFGLAFSVIVARFYGAEVVGIVAVINSFLMLATIFTVLGTPTSILRLIPEHLAKYSLKSAFKVYHKTQYMVIAVSVITASLFFFGASLIADRVFSKPQFSYYFALSSIFVVFKSMMELNTQVIRGLRLIKFFAIMQFLPQTFNLFFLIAIGFLWPGRNVPVYALLSGFALTSITSLIIVENAFKKRIQPTDRIKPVSGRTILTISLPMLMSATMDFIVAQTGVLMLGIFHTEAEVGYYAIAVKLASLSGFVLQAVNSMAGPKFSELYYTNKINDLFHVAKKSAKLIFITTTPILVGFVSFGKPILNLFFGKEFAIAYIPLVILVFGQFVNSVSGSTGMFMNMTGNQNTYRNIMIITAVLNIGLNFWLVPRFSIKGAAIADMVSLCFWNITTLLYIKLKFGRTTGYFPILSFR